MPGHVFIATGDIARLACDVLFERACEMVGRPVCVLPYEASDPDRRWLLKLHGCIRETGDIVLTREDYIRYEARRAALSGIVQSLLLTRHMLFVDFSHSDDNFHRIVDEVRRALRSRGDRDEASQRFGTTLSVSSNAFLRELWARDLAWVSLDDGAGDTAAAGRTLEVFLDRLAASATAPAEQVFQHRIEHLLTDGERQLRDALRAFLEAVPQEAREVPAWREVERMLLRLGWPR